MPFAEVNPLSEAVGQSPPVDTAAPFDTASLAGKTILITGGASGFGAAFARHWAQHGAHIAVGDIDDAAGEALVAELRATTPGGAYHHYHHCDVTSWPSQVAFFRAAVAHSATGCLHAVVPNAGIADRGSPVAGRGFENPAVPSGAAADDDPRQPGLDVINVNLTGVLYTVHLALHWLPKNGSGGGGAGTRPDRHILLLSSVAGLFGLPGQALYTASKHAVTGLFRALRGTAHVQGVRVNMLCPYFVETNILPTTGLLLLAGGGAATVDDVVDAATRLMADETIAGRGLVVAPPMLLQASGCGGDRGGHAAAAAAAAAADLLTDDDVQVLDPSADKAAGGAGAAPGRRVVRQAVWECYAEDFNNSEVFVNRFVRLLNAVAAMRGWAGFVRDIVSVLWHAKRPSAKRPPRTP